MPDQIQTVKDYLLATQKKICSAFENEDAEKKFIADVWENPGNGSGISCILEDGPVIERGGVNFSHVFGCHLPMAATTKHPELAGCSFQAMGISVVIHPRNPYAPTTHCNVRFFSADTPGGETVWWFGGGFDLTPYYGFVEDCVHWQQTARAACEPFGADIYPQFKRTCDDYFYLPHRNEPRGIGGLFFDDLDFQDFEKSFAFLQSVAENFVRAYQPILARRKNTPYGVREREFQCYRRGRYVEFNLLYDRGTLFGLQSKGRVESILMSLPPTVNWRYDFHPQPGSAEEKLYQEFLVAKDWL